jgi:putative membrane protein
MQHVITYDLARGLHVIAVIAWMSGLLMLPRFYACITATPRGDPVEERLLKSAAVIRTLVMAPALVLSWALGLFLFGAYFISDFEAPLTETLTYIPAWFWAKLTLVIGLSAYHGFLITNGRKLAAGERRHSEGFWDIMSAAPFIVAVAAVLLATLEP